MNQRKLEGSNAPDSFEIHLNYDDDPEEGKNNEYSSLLVSIKGNMLTKEERRVRFSVHGVEGSYIKYGLDVQEDQLKSGMTPLKNKEVFGIEEKEEQWGELTVSNEKGEVVTKKIPTKNGTYIEFYKNIAEGK